MKKPFRLKPEDVTWTLTGGASGPSPGPRSSRARQTRNAATTLVHVPTGVQVTGEVPAGNYTREQMAEETRRLGERLMAELEQLVASRLRTPGR